MEQLSQSMFCKNIAHLASIQGSQISIATAKLAIFLQDILWESCLEFNLEQLSHSMFCKNIACLASIQGSQVSIATAKLAIFLQNILWESCSKFNFKQLSHSMFCKNIASLAVNSCCYRNLCSLDTGQTSDILTEHTLGKLSQILFWTFLL